MNVLKKNSRKSIFFWIAVALAGVLPLWALTVYSTSTQYTGTEFSPYSFQTREFQYQLNLFPSLGRGVTTVDTGIPCSSPEITKHLTNATQTPIALARWDLVRTDTGAGSRPFQGEAAILVNTLKIQDSSTRILAWELWSTDNPSLAAILWPAIQQIAIHHAYFVIPELLSEIERTKPDESEISEIIGKFSISGALLQSERLVALEEWEQALECIRWGLSFAESQREESPNGKRLRELVSLTTSHVDTEKKQ
ncbi:MAG: hypothetical protein NTW52_02205 [Planctomycetota bacterium]|nr:hypothetical protein [Planctomycetota bacterium]